MASRKRFDPKCKRCPRLCDFLADTKSRYPDYHCRPVAAFGANNPALLIVGLAPGLHGANATGRPFTGDFAGILLYETLHRHGFSNCSESRAANDGLELKDCRITNAVKCLPPANKPTTAEVKECNQFLARELGDLEPSAVVIALGRIAHEAIMRALGFGLATYTFGHAAQHVIPDKFTLIDSYHCSRYNTQTNRLTPAMFDAVFTAAKVVIGNRTVKS